MPRLPRFGFTSVFSKLFTSVMLTLVLFAIAMVTLLNVVHNNSVDARWEVLANQIVTQVDPFIDELDNATTMNELLQARFMLAVIKKSFDIFDESLDARMGLYDREGNLLIQTDDSDLPKTLPEDPSFMSRVLPAFFSTDTVNVTAMSDRGFTLLYEPRTPPQRSELWAVLNWFTGTIALVALMSLVLWWIARSMTWRLNKMSNQMVELGEGNFSVRVPAKGNDEIATLARGFNQAAQKIEQLINANKLLLAHASHELRTPITRIRLQVEMMDMLANELSPESQAKFKKRAQAINRDLTGLNDLVESILLVSRLDAGHAAENYENFDFFELVKQECQHYSDAKLSGQSIKIDGQPKLLTHLIRNLLNNALIHGKAPILVQVYGVAELSEAYSPSDTNLDDNSFTDLHDASQHNLLTPNESFNDVEQGGDEKPADESGLRTPDKETDKVINITTDKTTAVNTLTQSDHGNIQHIDKVQPDNASKTLVDNSDSKHDKLSKDTPVEQHKKEPKYKNTETVVGKRLRKQEPNKANSNNFVVLSVIDQGTGIPLDKREEIFSPFVRLQQQKKGSGIGLSLVSQIVEAHNGSIKTDTYQGHTRFIVVLPIDKNNVVTKPSFS